MKPVPLGMQLSIAKYLIQQKIKGVKKFPLVTMLEPLHACNFHCGGCGRIREYIDTIKLQMSLEECLQAVEETDTPIVSICGGEPLIYRHIVPLVRELQKRGKYIYLCTNALLLEKKLHEFVADKHLIFNIHLDGMEKTHDAIVEWPGSFKVAVAAARAAKAKGFLVCSNITIYKQTEMDEVVELAEFLEGVGIDGMLISPAYTYAVIDQDYFLDRSGVVRQFQSLAPRLKKFKFWNSPLFLNFLAGKVKLKCTPWGNPTRNPKGWRGPCYQVAEAHYPTFKDLMEKTDWEYWVSAEDPHCKNCMTHCGFEPSSALELISHPLQAAKVMMGQSS